MQYHSNSTDPKMEFNAILRSLVIALKANVFAGGGGVMPLQIKNISYDQ